jgi:hypothetical protein
MCVYGCIGPRRRVLCVYICVSNHIIVGNNLAICMHTLTHKTNKIQKKINTHQHNDTNTKWISVLTISLAVCHAHTNTQTDDTHIWRSCCARRGAHGAARVAAGSAKRRDEGLRVWSWHSATLHIYNIYIHTHTHTNIHNTSHISRAYTVIRSQRACGSSAAAFDQQAAGTRQCKDAAARRKQVAQRRI